MASKAKKKSSQSSPSSWELSLTPTSSATGQKSLSSSEEYEAISRVSELLKRRRENGATEQPIDPIFSKYPLI